jgi:putative ABC transport system permease protein
MSLDLLHLIRHLRRAPASAIAAVLTLALTLGAGASIFAVVDAVLLTPPPFADPAQLVTLGETPVGEPDAPPRAVSFATFEAWRDRAGSLGRIEGFDPTNLTITGLGAAERTSATDVTPGFLALLGAEPVLGRGFASDDGGRPVAIVSDAFWRGKLGADPEVVGRDLVLGGQTHTIVGVLPAQFVFALNLSDVWRPLPVSAADAERAGVRVRPIARLAPGVPAAALAEALTDISRTGSPPALVVSTEIATAISRSATGTLALLSAAAALAVLIAFTNLAGLLMLRSLDRGRELAVRSALGARQSEVARQLLLEAVALVAMGTIGGVLLASWLAPTVGELALQQVGGIAGRNVAVNWRTIGGVSLVALACALLCGSLPAIVAARRSVVDVLRRGTTANPRERITRRVFVTAVVSLAFVLLASMGFVGRSLIRLLEVNPGFTASTVSTAAVALPPARYPDAARMIAFYSTLHAALEQRLGTGAIGIIDELPLTGDRGRSLVGLQQTAPEREAVLRTASSGYFEAMRLPIVAGRSFVRSDDQSAPPRVVISELLAERVFGTTPAIGRRLWVAATGQFAEIVGVAGDVRHRALDEPVLATVYLSLWQRPSRGSRIAVRSARANVDSIAVVRDEVAGLDRDMPVYGRGTMSDIVARSQGVPARRVLTAAFMGFALLALVLSGLGLFGVVAHDVASRRSELALRMALGANPARILAATIGQGAVMVGAALALGIVLSVWTSRALRGFLVANDGFDLLAIGLAAGVLMLVGAAAVLPAARRAATTDPLLALKAE